MEVLQTQVHICHIHRYPIKCAQDLAKLCFIVIIFQFFVDLYHLFSYILQGPFSGTEVIKWKYPRKKGVKLAPVWHYNDVIMNVMASRIIGLTIVYSSIYSGADQRKHQKSSSSLAFVRGIHRWPVNSPHKRPVTWKTLHLMTSSWYLVVCPPRIPCQGPLSLTKFYGKRPWGAGLRTVNHAEGWCKNPVKALAQVVFSQHLECRIHWSESSPERSSH